jgi:hypothetical protein
VPREKRGGIKPPLEDWHVARLKDCGRSGFDGWLRGWFGHELFGFGEGLRDGNFGAGLVDVVDVDGRIEHENCRAGF